MANLIPKELDALIKEYLTDGVLTAQERRVILKKAEKLNLDVEEVDLYLEAQVQKIKKSDMEADIRRKGQTCPFCGENVPPLTDKCPYCEHIITTEATDDLKSIIEELEAAIENLKAIAHKKVSELSVASFRTNGETETEAINKFNYAKAHENDKFYEQKAKVERCIRRAKTYYGSNPKIKLLIEDVEAEIKEAQNHINAIDKKRKKKNMIIGICFLVFFLTIIILAGVLGSK